MGSFHKNLVETLLSDIGPNGFLQLVLLLSSSGYKNYCQLLFEGHL